MKVLVLILSIIFVNSISYAASPEVNLSKFNCLQLKNMYTISTVSLEDSKTDFRYCVKHLNNIECAGHLVVVSFWANFKSLLKEEIKNRYSCSISSSPNS